MHNYNADFYDEEMRLVVVGYIRPEWDFKSKGIKCRSIHLAF